MIEAKQKTLEEATQFRNLRIEADENSMIIRLGEYSVFVNRADLAAYCLCPSGTLGGTAEEPLIFTPDEEHGSRKPCRHIRAAWSLAPLLWSLGARERVSDEPLVRTFWREYDRSSEKEIKKAIARGIQNAVKVAHSRSIDGYLNGKREFSTDLIADLEVPEARTQRWKAAVAKNLVSAGFWLMTDRSINRGGGTHSLIRVYLAGPALVSMCDEIEGRRDG